MKDNNCMKILIGGMGSAVRGLLALLEQDTTQADFLIVGISDSQGTACSQEGLSVREIQEAKSKAGSVAFVPGKGHMGMDTAEMIQKCEADMFIDCLPANLPDGLEAYHCEREALNKGMHVVAANKLPLALHWRELMNLSKQNGVLIRCSTAASTGLPVLEMGRMLAETEELTGFEGVFSASCMYVLSCLEQGLSMEHALKQASEGGFLEADPSIDLDGWDMAMKTVILANSFWDAGIVLSDVKRTGISDLDTEQIRRDAQEGKKWCILGKCEWRQEKWQVSVEPVCVFADHPFARMDCSDKAILLHTRTQGEQVHFGCGASATGTAGSIYMDMKNLSRQTRS